MRVSKVCYIHQVYTKSTSPDASLSTAGFLVLAGLAKIFLTILAAGLPVPAGFYVPCMAIGACFGRALGMLVQTWRR
jgi:chloride channel 3/4/5